MTNLTSNHIPIDTLRYIALLDDGMTFKQIASFVGKSRQAISQAVSTAEKRIGLSIIDSSTPGTTLTDKGKRIASLARKAVENYDQVAMFVSVIQREKHNGN